MERSCGRLYWDPFWEFYVATWISPIAKCIAAFKSVVEWYSSTMATPCTIYPSSWPLYSSEPFIKFFCKKLIEVEGKMLPRAKVKMKHRYRVLDGALPSSHKWTKTSNSGSRCPFSLCEILNSLGTCLHSLESKSRPRPGRCARAYSTLAPRMYAKVPFWLERFFIIWVMRYCIVELKSAPPLMDATMDFDKRMDSNVAKRSMERTNIPFQIFYIWSVNFFFSLTEVVQ